MSRARYDPFTDDCEPEAESLAYSKRHWRFTRVYLSGIERMAEIPQHAQRMFWWLARESDHYNVVTTPIDDLAFAMEISTRTAYRHIESLKAAGLLIAFEARRRSSKSPVNVRKKVLMLDPSLVYSGDFKYHRRTVMQFGIIVSQQQQELRKRSGSAKPLENDDDQASDLQP